MFKLLNTLIISYFITGCTFQHRPDMSAKPLIKESYGSLLTNKNNNNKDFFNYFK